MASRSSGLISPRPGSRPLPSPDMAWSVRIDAGISHSSDIDGRHHSYGGEGCQGNAPVRTARLVRRNRAGAAQARAVRRWRFLCLPGSPHDLNYTRKIPAAGLAALRCYGFAVLPDGDWGVVPSPAGGEVGAAAGGAAGTGAPCGAGEAASGAVCGTGGGGAAVSVAVFSILASSSGTKAVVRARPRMPSSTRETTKTRRFMTRREPWRASVGVRTVFDSGERFAFMAVPFLLSMLWIKRG